MWYEAKHWGWKGVALFSITVNVIALVVALVILPGLGADTTPLSSDAPRVPAVGVEGYSGAALLAFCRDSHSEVKVSIAPDVGLTYYLSRTVDGKPEAVTVVKKMAGDWVPGRHYFNTTVDQSSEPVSDIPDAAKACIEAKAR